MVEHRWTIPCSLDPDEAEQKLKEPIRTLEKEGFDVIPHIETVGFFGWTLRWSEDQAVGVSVPQPGGPQRLKVRSDHEAVGETVVQAFTRVGPLKGETIQKKQGKGTS